MPRIKKIKDIECVNKPTKKELAVEIAMSELHCSLCPPHKKCNVTHYGKHSDHGQKRKYKNKRRQT